MVTKEDGTTAYIRSHLLEAQSDQELEEICVQLKDDPDISEGSVDAEKSKLKKKGAFNFKQAPATKAVTSGKAAPVEALINELNLPPMVDGSRLVFNSGVEYGMKSILIGVRVAQELSKMGIDQATPIIRMAQQMSPDTSRVAQETGAAMGEALASKMFDYLEKKPQKADIATVSDPMKGLAARMMELVMNRLMGGLMGGDTGNAPGFVDKRDQGGK